MNKATSDYDIVVIGGGIAGLYSAWRLINADRENPALLKKWKKKSKLRIAVYEGSDRLGGRIMTATPPNFNGAMDCEIGGMRVVDSQKYMYSLIIKKLKLNTYPQVVGESMNILYLRNKRLRNFQLNDPNALPYNFTEEERLALQSGATTADNFLGWAVLKILPGMVQNGSVLSGDALRTFLRGVVVDGIPLYKIGFWNLVAKALSHEAYQVAIKAVGYDVLGSNTNAVDSIAEYFDFTPTAKFYLVQGGYSVTPWTIAKQFEEAGGTIFKGKWLERFDDVQLEDKSTGVQLNMYKQAKPINAAGVILAMPPRSLELLEPSGPVLDPGRAPQLKEMINSVARISLFKLVLVYDNPWWQKAAYVTKGRSLTDLPVRQLYYWGAEFDPKTGTTGKAILMAYNDEESTSFWAGFRTEPLGEDGAVEWPNAHPTHTLHHAASASFKSSNKLEAKKASKTDDPWLPEKLKNWSSHLAPARMVDEMHKQIMEMHGVTEASAPIDAAFKDWADDPYGAAVHFWNIGHKSWEVMANITQPVKNFPCFICNEAWSENQTWAEGSLQSAEIMLQKHFNLKEPDWVQQS